MTAAIPSYDGDLFTDDVLLDPHAHYAALRELGPVVSLQTHDMLAVARYAEARAVLADPDTFVSGQGVGMNELVNGFGAGKSTLMSDGERHDFLRGILAHGLMPRALRSMAERIQKLADERVASLVEQGSFDAVTDLARAVPLAVVPDLVGWPAGGREHLLQWAAASFDMLGPLNPRAEQASLDAVAMIAFAEKTAAERGFTPESLGAKMLDGAAKGELGADQVPPLVVDYIAPSLDTTISAIGSAVWLLARHSEQWARLKAEPGLIPNAFNEVVRLESPIRCFTRVAAKATTLGGHEVSPGTRVVVLFASANRDERKFERPEIFDIGRKNAAEHIGFGYGLHTCAGQGLARLEAHAVLKALVAQVERIELGEPRRGLNNLINAFASLPVTVQPATAAVKV